MNKGLIFAAGVGVGLVASTKVLGLCMGYLMKNESVSYTMRDKEAGTTQIWDVYFGKNHDKNVGFVYRRDADVKEKESKVNETESTEAAKDNVQESAAE